MKFFNLFFLFLPLGLCAQSFVNRTYSSTMDLEAKSAVRMGNGNYLVVGTQLFDHGFLSIHDSTGACIQSSFLSQGALSSYSDFSQIVKLNDSVAVIGGRISMAIGPMEIWQGVIMLVNAQGNVLWSTIQGTSESGTDVEVKDIERINDTSFLSVHATLSGTRSIINQYTLSGVIQWSKEYNSNSGTFQINDVSWDDSLIYACGTKVNSGNYEGVILTLDSLGNVSDGKAYNHSSQPEFIQILRQNNSLILASRGHAMNVMDLLKVGMDGSLMDQKTFPFDMMMPEEASLKPLSDIDNQSFWYWRGGSFGGTAYKMESNSFSPMLSLMHMGNIQKIEEQNSDILMLSSGPLYGIKNQWVTQKHYALSKADSVEGFYVYCTSPDNFPPNNETPPTVTSLVPVVVSAPVSNPLIYPLVPNDPWVNEPSCVEFLGSLSEGTLQYGPNPCDKVFRVENFNNMNYTLYSPEGRLCKLGTTNAMGELEVNDLKNGAYILSIQGATLRLLVQH